MQIVWTKKSVSEFQKLPLNVRKKIIEKLDFWFLSEYPMHFARQIIGVRPSQYRFRLGKYRIIGAIEKNNFLILKIGHRKDVYK